MMFWKKLYPYEVTVHLSGRHPYLKGHELDGVTRDVVLTVPAKDWNQAERQALDATASLPDKWSWWVKSIEKVRA